MAIDFSLLQPIDIGGQFLAGMQAAQQARQQREQQQQAMQRAQQMQQDIAAWQSDMSPERTASLLMNYPEIKDQITASKSVLDEAGKRDRLGFTTKALMLSRAGQTDEVIKMAEQRIAAYRNAGKQREAKEAQDILEAYKLNPKVGEGMLTIDIAADDPKLYETMFGKTDKPYEVVPGVGVVLKRDIEAAIAAGDKGTVDVYQEGATATNPKTGQKLMLRGGKWVPVGGGSGNATEGFPAAGGAR